MRIAPDFRAGQRFQDIRVNAGSPLRARAAFRRLSTPSTTGMLPKNVTHTRAKAIIAKSVPLPSCQAHTKIAASTMTIPAIAYLTAFHSFQRPSTAKSIDERRRLPSSPTLWLPTLTMDRSWSAHDALVLRPAAQLLSRWQFDEPPLAADQDACIASTAEHPPTPSRTSWSSMATNLSVSNSTMISGASRSRARSLASTHRAPQSMTASAFADRTPPSTTSFISVSRYRRRTGTLPRACRVRVLLFCDTPEHAGIQTPARPQVQVRFAPARDVRIFATSSRRANRHRGAAHQRATNQGFQVLTTPAS